MMIRSERDRSRSCSETFPDTVLDPGATAVRNSSSVDILGKLMGGVAHDFNNLLTIILGYTDILLARKPASDPDRELLAEIHRAVERAESLTRQLQAFTRKHATGSKLLDLNSVLSDTEKILRRLIGADILMTTIFAPTLCAVEADPGQIEQLILNLAVQARGAMPRGGRLTIETDNVNLESGRHAMLSIAHGHTAAMPEYHSVHRSATPGNPPGDSRPAGGEASPPGAQLDLIRSIVLQHGGQLEVHAQPDGACAYYIYLPEAVEVDSSPAGNSSLREAPRGNETVLLIEDEDSVRALARHVLQACGYTVIDAAHGEAALDLVETYHGPIHLLVSDVVMPHLCGRPLAERLLALRPQMRILFLSGYTDDALERHGLASTEYAFLQKPFTSSALAEMVRGVLDAAVR